MYNNSAAYLERRADFLVYLPDIDRVTENEIGAANRWAIAVSYDRTSKLMMVKFYFGRGKCPYRNICEKEFWPIC